MESTKNTQVMATKEEMEEQNGENMIYLLKKVKVLTSFVEKLEKELGYHEFQQEVDWKRQEFWNKNKLEKISKLMQ